MTVFVPHFKSFILKQIIPIKESKGNYISVEIEIIVIFLIYLFPRHR